jgi:hypothetical protein
VQALSSQRNAGEKGRKSPDKESSARRSHERITAKRSTKAQHLGGPTNAESSSSQGTCQALVARLVDEFPPGSLMGHPNVEPYTLAGVDFQKIRPPNRPGLA